MKVLSLVGARPQYIKEAVINKALKEIGVEEIIVNSGQHYDFNMSDIFFRTLNIQAPKYNLKVGSGSHAEMTAKIMVGFEKVLETEKPDKVLVYGDTNTTLAGALTATKMHIPVGHVEAGVRMAIKGMPEELNRVLTDHSSEYLFTATKSCVANLKAEGITAGVYFTGDVLYDLYLRMRSDFRYDTFRDLNLKEGSYMLVTLHRDFNIDNVEKLTAILQSLADISKTLRVVFPLHPRTKARIESFGLQKLIESISTTAPLEYLDLMGLVSKSALVLTDSGGLSKEAYFAEKYCLVMMEDSTVRELLGTGFQKLCNESNFRKLVEQGSWTKYRKGLFGNGTAGEKIAGIINRAGK